VSRRVLVIDDEGDIRLLMRVMLRQAGVEVEEASSASEGLERLRTSEPDLVLLDIRLPDGDGFEILEQMKQSGQIERVPVVMVSAHSTPSTRLRALAEGAAGYVTKPFTGTELLSAVERALAS
jgi:CheY-like chemotaxis protein